VTADPWTPSLRRATPAVWRPTTAEKRDWRSRHTATDRRQIASRDVTTGSDRHEKVMLAYFMQRSKLLKPSTMWSEYSKLRTTIYLNKKVDISKFNNLIAFLKRQSEGYRGKKSKVFTMDEVHAFLKEANDETYLMLKVQEKNY
jgi:hypothetical protein